MQAIVELALKQRLLTVILFVMTLVGGVAAFRVLNIEAYPDPVPPLVDVIVQSPGLSAEEVERYITIPIETQIAGLPNAHVLRSISLYGLSDVKLQFTFDYTYEEAVQQVLNRLSQLSGLPPGVSPEISPTSPIGEIYRYRLKGPPGYSSLDLKTLQDWVLQRRFRSVPGVIDVTGWGGRTKTFELQVDLNKLVAYGLTLSQLMQTLNNSNINVGGSTINLGAQSAVVRGVGLIRSLEDLSSTMLTQAGGNPVLVRDVASVVVGNSPRLGIAGMNEDDDIVQGIVLMRRGEKSTPTIQRVEAEVNLINSSGILPPGVGIERIYDRQELINLTTSTVLHNMVVGILLIFLLQWLFLGDLRSAAIVAATIPFALSCAVGIMVLRGEFANLLSVGAIDFGLIVDATVIMVERIFRQLSAPAGTFPVQARASGLTRKVSRHLSGGRNSAAIDTVRRGHHHRRFHPALHVDRRRRPHLRADGKDVRVRARRWPACDVHRHAGAQRLPAARACARDGDIPRTHVAQDLYAGAPRLRRQPIPRAHGALMLLGLAGVVARSLGVEFMPKLEEGNLGLSRHAARHHFAGGGQRLRQPHA